MTSRRSFRWAAAASLLAVSFIAACAKAEQSTPTASTATAVPPSTTGIDDGPTGTTPATNDATRPTVTSPPFDSAIYSDSARWLCSPDVPAATSDCTPPSTRQLVDAVGNVLESDPVAVDPNPRADCFYVYPTISQDPDPQSDLEPGGEERSVTRLQFGPYSAFCRPFAPVYRQVSSMGLAAGTGSFDTAAKDVIEAFRYYLGRYNAGRPFILVGHSQGSLMVQRIIDEVIRADQGVASRFVAAHAIGFAYEPRPGRPPLCDSPSRTGCVVAYSSFLDTSPPPPDGGLFAGPKASCVNPAAPGQDASKLRAVLPGDPSVLKVVKSDLSGTCRRDGGRVWLEITSTELPVRALLEAGASRSNNGWGLHALDINLAHADLLELAKSQIEAMR